MNAKRINSNAGITPSFASQAKAKGLSITKNTNKKSTKQPVTFASQAKAKGLSVAENANANSMKQPVMGVKKSDSKASITPSFASQAKSNGLYIARNTKKGTTNTRQPMMD